jgi:DNA repair protein RadA/Sms
VTVQGRRALPVEIQTLVASSGSAEARRTVSGLDSSRVSMVLAVLQRWGGLKIGGQDVLAATVGGARTTEPASDLAIAMAVWSSVRDIPLSSGLVAIGEIGLAADVRPVAGISRRLVEAGRLGFDHAVVPASDGAGGSIEGPPGMRVSVVEDLGGALRALGDDSGVVRWLRERPA